MATSREVLGLDGEHVLAVRPLDPSTTAGELFRQRAVGGRRRPGDAGAGVDRRAVPAPRRPPAGHRAGGGADGDARRGRDRRRARRPARPGRRAAAAAARTATARCGPRSSGRTGCSTTTSSSCSAGWPCSPTGSSSTRPATSPTCSASTTRRPPSTSPRSCTRACSRPTPTPTACATGCWRRCGRSPSSAWTSSTSGCPRCTALADWVATITDLPFADPCSAAVERNALRLEREADNWREAVVTATAAAARGELAAALCGPPVAFFLLGRHDLADVVRPLLELCDDAEQRRGRAERAHRVGLRRHRAGPAAGVGRRGGDDRRSRIPPAWAG